MYKRINIFYYRIFYFIVTLFLIKNYFEDIKHNCINLECTPYLEAKAVSNKNQ